MVAQNGRISNPHSKQRSAAEDKLPEKMGMGTEAIGGPGKGYFQGYFSHDSSLTSRYVFS
jgi:hypothetical protein